MYQPVALFIGLRYMRGRAADRFGRFVSWLSTIGITLGVMALVTVLSVMNGFERELQNNILGLMPQAILSSEHGSLNPQQLPETAVKLDGVNRVAPITTGDVVLQSARSVAVGVMLGIDPAQKDPLTPVVIGATRLTPSSLTAVSGSCCGLREPCSEERIACGIRPRMLFCSSRSKPFITDNTVTSAITPRVMPMVESQETKRPKRSAARPRM